MVVAYELFIAAQATLQPSERALAQAGELENFIEHLQKTLEDIGFIDRAVNGTGEIREPEGVLIVLARDPL